MAIVISNILDFGVSRHAAAAIILTTRVWLCVVHITPVFYGHIQAVGFGGPGVASYCTDYIVHF